MTSLKKERRLQPLAHISPHILEDIRCHCSIPRGGGKCSFLMHVKLCLSKSYYLELRVPGSAFWILSLTPSPPSRFVKNGCAGG